LFVLGCAGSDDLAQGSTAQASGSHTQIHTEDDCDPVTFGALCKPGFNGSTTLDEFRAELAATQDVQAWEYGGGEIRISQGQTFRVDNTGGETHTFSVVANFGGGRVPGLNTASGNPVVAPECVAGPNATNVDLAAGTGITVTTGSTGAMKTKGTFRVQCCIHPWMRTTVVIN
jgi:plastocyanin